MNACKKNRKNWLHLAEGTREEKHEDNCSLYFETEILEEEEAERGAEQLAEEQNTWYFEAFFAHIRTENESGTHCQ